MHLARDRYRGVDSRCRGHERDGDDDALRVRWLTHAPPTDPAESDGGASQILSGGLWPSRRLEAEEVDDLRGNLPGWPLAHRYHVHARLLVRHLKVIELAG